MIARATQHRLSIRAMAASVPASVQTVAEAASDLSLTPIQVKMFGRLFGLNTLPHDPQQTLAELLGDAYSRLLQKAPEDVARARYILHCHTIPMVRPPSELPINGIALPPSAEQMSVTMAHCASGLMALDLLTSLLHPNETAIVLVGEKAFHPRVRMIEDTTLMSDGAVAVLVGAGHGHWVVAGTHVTQDGTNALARGHPTEEPQLVDDYIEFVAAHMKTALRRFGLTAPELRLILPHNVNMVSWGAIAKKLNLTLSAVFTDNIPRIGHCFGADPFLNLLTADQERAFSPGDKLLCVSVGMGMSAASSLIEISSPPQHRSSDFILSKYERTPANATQ